MKKILSPITLCLVLMLAACNNDRLPKDVLDHQQMVDFLCESYLLEGYCAIETRYNFDSLTPEMIYAYDDILAEQGITREQVEASLEYYSRHPEKYKAIHEEVSAALQENKQEITEEEDSVSVDM